MTVQRLRLVYAFEFLIAMMAIFTSWSEIGGQSALDLMNWGWKLGFSLLLAASIVAFTASVAAGESFWTMRSARWMTAIVLIIVGMGIVTYFYSLQEDAGSTDELGTVSLNRPVKAHVEVLT